MNRDRKRIVRVIAGACLALAVTQPGWSAQGASAVVAAVDSKVAEARLAVPDLTAAQIVQKHVEARGGEGAWRAVSAMSIAGKMEVGSGNVDRARRIAEGTGRRRGARGATVANADDGSGAASSTRQTLLPFVMEMKRPNLSRVEIEFAGKTAIQVYDGTQGWKLRPFLNRTEVEPFTADEMKATTGKWAVEGPLFDAGAGGRKVVLEGVEAVEGRDAYKLKVIQANGREQRVWIDARSFLDVKVEGFPRLMDGKMRDVFVYQRDFRPVQGLMVPYVLETAVDGYADTHKMLLDKVTINPVLADKRFVKPEV